MTSLPFRPSDGVPPPPPKACSRRSDSRRGRKKKKTRKSREGKRVLSFSPQSQLVFPSFSPRTISLAPQHLNVAGKATECAKVLPYPCVLVRRPPTYTVGYRHALLTSERSAWPSTKGDVTRDDSQRRFLVQHSVGMLNNVVTIRNNVGTMLQRFVEPKIVRGYTVCLIQSKTHASATSFSKLFLKKDL